MHKNTGTFFGKYIIIDLVLGKIIAKANSLEDAVDLLKKECKLNNKDYNDFGIFASNSMATFDGKYFYINEEEEKDD